MIEEKYGKKVFKFLGGGYYKECTYKCSELSKDKVREYKTCFIQMEIVIILKILLMKF